MSRKISVLNPKAAVNTGFQDIYDTEVNLKIRVLTVVALAGAIGNTLGFLANLLLYGINFVTAFCGICAVLLLCYLLLGLNSRNSVSFGFLMLFILDMLEFPLLTLTYGAVMYPYMIIGFHAVVMLSEKRKRIILCVLLGIYDIAIIVYSSLNPYIFGPQDSIGLMGSAIITFAISITAIAVLIILWQTVYLVETEEIDSVTGALSRSGFNANVEKVLRADSNGDYAILYFNTVSFKTINSIFGIDGGNEFLGSLADRLSQASFKPRLVGRLSADHFVCFVKRDMLDYGSLEGFCQMPFSSKGRTITALLYCGIYNITDKTLPVPVMCDRAKAALKYLHKSGNKFYAIYDGKADTGYKEETELLGEIDSALYDGQFRPYYQPIVDCGTGKIISAEALARWVHPEAGLISPAVFIPVLEKKDMISKLDRTIAGQVHGLIEKRRAEGLRMVPVSVNLSRTDLYDKALMDELYSMVSAADNECHRFEITESAYEDMSSYTLGIISSLRKNGAAILVDDFGSGYSSLGMITDYEFDIIKLDIQFASKISGNDKMRGMVQCLIEMSHKLGAKVVAEGVENEEQYIAIKECGCDYVQGYYFYRPMPEADFVALLDSEAASEAVYSSLI